MIAYCPACNQTNTDSSVFCRRCTFALRAVRAALGMLAFVAILPVATLLSVRWG